jgi:hypothetical protein
MYTIDFIQDRIQHYQHLLSIAKSDEERSFLRAEVHRFKSLLKNS